jgi:hypothetical protein
MLCSKLSACPWLCAEALFPLCVAILAALFTHDYQSCGLQLDSGLLARTHGTQRALLNHQGHDLVQDILCRVSIRPASLYGLLTAAAIVVSSALVSYAGATSTISVAIRLMPSRPRMMVRSSRVVQPPVSGVPVAGATGSSCQAAHNSS